MGVLSEALLDDVVSVCGSGGQVVEVDVKIRGQVGTIRETGDDAAGRRVDRDRIGFDVVEELGDGRCAE